MHGPQNSIGEGLDKNRFDPLLAEGAHEGVSKCNLPKSIDGGLLLDDTGRAQRAASTAYGIRLTWRWRQRAKLRGTPPQKCGRGQSLLPPRNGIERGRQR